MMKGSILLRVALFLLPLSVLLHAGSPASLEIQAQALKAFKDSITHDPFGTLSGWSDIAHHCNWSGIACDPSKHHVISISLAGKHLAGTISPFLGNITSLQVLDLSSNLFIGAIPSQLGYCCRLLELNLCGNSLSGLIPPELGSLRNLESINLGNNSLSESIPESIGNLARLKYFIAYGNNLGGSIPYAIARLESLLAMDLSQNQLLGEIPRQIGNLSKLEYLILSKNKLIGNIPVELGFCSWLVSIDLTENFIGGNIPSNIGLLHHLVNLTLNNNFLEGTIPSTISNCTRLYNVRLQFNRISGKIPDDLGKLQYLRFFKLHGNMISGEIPDSIFNCSNLEALILANNKFSGMIKPTVGKLNNLCALEVQNNSLVGPIPREIGNLSKLMCLNVGFNNLSGIVPQEILKLSLLQGLFLSHNLFEGLIPEGIFNFTQLSNMQLQNNKFSGVIPDVSSARPVLSILNLGQNMLHGSIPSSFVHLSALNVLDLSHNYLIGSVPKSFISSLKSLQIYLNLSHNLLTGPIPDELGMLDMVQTIDISNNKLSGSIPVTLGDCKNLINLDLSGNELSHQIPNEVFTRWDMLVRLNLSKNQLYGELPTSLGDLQHLASLDLSQNNLSGVIPEKFGSLPSLEILNLSYNQLDGPIPMTGMFAAIDPSSLAGNLALCGAKFLNPCHRSSLLDKTIMILVVVGSIFMLSVLLSAFYLLKQCIHIHRTEKQNNPDSLCATRLALRRFEHKDLEVATCSFSEQSIISATTLSTVYKGRLTDGQIVAIKKFNSQHFPKESEKCFSREVKTLSQLKHKSLVKAIGYAWDDQKLKALVLEYMENGNLETVIHGPGLDCPKWSLLERIDVLISIASGLDYMHSGFNVPIVHCDLKPSNILLDGDCRAHVSDFGTSCILGVHLNCESSLTTTVAFEGTIGYLPPEFAYMRKVTTKVDVFSFGIVVMEFLMKQRPIGVMNEDGSPITLRELVETALISGRNRLIQVVDPFLASNDSEEDVEKIDGLLKVALSCTSSEPKDRPDMNEVLCLLFKLRAA